MENIIKTEYSLKVDQCFLMESVKKGIRPHNIEAAIFHFFNFELWLSAQRDEEAFYCNIQISVLYALNFYRFQHLKYFQTNCTS